MNIVISNKSDAPIYEQIKEQICLAIIRDELAEGEMLPSIRALAHDLKISVITTMRAYNELEAEGFIATMQGKGCFVLPKNKEHIQEQKLKEIERHFAEAIACGNSVGITKAELKKILDILLKE
ncbi:MAG: GntR family transcriptional regulator [Firmicutes bacterium]|nr:GntR family transcriptional regulator [Bacillota bacterium]